VADNRLILLGTKGGPRIGKGTSWPTSNLLVVEGKPYLIDAGLGVTRQVCNAGFLPFDIDRIFITHNHSDHNLELGGFIQTGWTSGPMKDMRIYGAPGIANLLEHHMEGQSFDINIRVEDEGATDLRKIVSWDEISEGPVYEDERVKVSCLRVIHPPVYHCYALKFETKAGTVVFGADTTYHPPLADFAKDADILVHEAMFVPGAKQICEYMKPVKPKLWEHFEASHTTCEDVGRIATQAQTKHLVLNHYVPDIGDRGATEEDYRQAVATTFDGKVTPGRDLMEIPFG
jgi:ribonuclease BN (tRNA processing enzyme)